MACTITSLILVAMFGVIAVGLVNRASLKGSPPARQNRNPDQSAPGVLLVSYRHVFGAHAALADPQTKG